MTKDHKVFGIGLNKTGTSSLKRALQKLGYNHCKRRGKMTAAFFNENWRVINQCMDEFDSFDDWPWPLMFKQVFERYGDKARYILTVRETPEIWVESLKSHSEAVSPDNNPRKNIYGYPYPHGVEVEHIDFYNNHINEVRQFFAKNNASHLLIELCWERGDGWAELCRFLNEPLPQNLFPHVNNKLFSSANPQVIEENRRRINAQLDRITKSASFDV